MSIPNEQEAASGQRLKGKIYYILFWIPTEAAGDRRAVHADHIAYVCSLEADGRLLAAGPFLDDAGNPNGQGMFILRVDSAAEAEAVAKADPYFCAGYRRYELRPWRRSEGSFNINIKIAANVVTLD
jgi:uncharacterized protein YciI